MGALFAGFIISYSQIPVHYQWVNRITPTTWVLYALSTSQVRSVLCEAIREPIKRMT